VDDVAVGRGLRALRKRKGWSQRDLAQRAGVHQSLISELETGRLDGIRLPTIRRIAMQLEVSIELAPRWPVADVARLLDASHARLVEQVVRLLRREGWEVVVEYSFNDYGDRGSVDVLAWHPVHRALLVVEVKSQIADIQETHATLDKKVRVVPRLVAREHGWRPAVVGRLLVIADTHGNRERVRRHATTFSTTFPARSRAARRWLREPVGVFAALWFLPDMALRDQADGRRPTRTSASAGGEPRRASLIAGSDQTPSKAPGAMGMIAVSDIGDEVGSPVRA
jgi:transcriptional regulator with XRE-family HTH domain